MESDLQAKAIDQIASIYNTAEDKSVIASAANDIEKLLQSSPHKLGESRKGMERVLIYPPLLVFFDVIHDDLKVRVLQIHVYQGRSKP